MLLKFFYIYVRFAQLAGVQQVRHHVQIFVVVVDSINKLIACREGYLP